MSKKIGDVFDLPTEYVYYDADREVTVYLDKVGGGTEGKKYQGYWRYVVVDNESVVRFEGADYITGMPKNHNESARDIVYWLFMMED